MSAHSRLRTREGRWRLWEEMFPGPLNYDDGVVEGPQIVDVLQLHVKDF
jgi:hypothetical protein